VASLARTATIYGINGPVIYLKGNTGFMMSEMVYVGEQKLVGEVISLDKDLTTVQVYEETSGLCPGEVVEATGNAVSVTLAPGILNSIFDGIERPLEKIAENSGDFITRGVSVESPSKSVRRFTAAISSPKFRKRLPLLTNAWFHPISMGLSSMWYRMALITLTNRSSPLNCRMEP